MQLRNHFAKVSTQHMQSLAMQQVQDGAVLAAAAGAGSLVGQQLLLLLLVGHAGRLAGTHGASVTAGAVAAAAAVQ